MYNTYQSIFQTKFTKKIKVKNNALNKQTDTYLCTK